MARHSSIPRRPNTTESGALACAFGAPWQKRIGRVHCAGCAKQELALLRAFKAGVERGQWDEQGYTPAERRVQRRRDG